MRRFTTDAYGQQWVDHGMGWVPVVQAAQPALGVSLGPNPCPPPGYPGHTIRNGNFCCQPSGCVPRPSPPGTLAVTQGDASRIAGACSSAGGTWVGGCVRGQCTGSCTARSGVTGSSITWTGSPV